MNLERLIHISEYTSLIQSKAAEKINNGKLGNIVNHQFKIIKAAGFFGLYFWMIFSLIPLLINASRAREGNITILVSTMVVGSLIIHFLAFKFLPLLDNLILTEKTQIGSRAIPDCVAYVAAFLKIFALLAILPGIYMTVTGESPVPLYISLLTLGFLDSIAGNSLSLKEIAVETEKSCTAPETIIGLTDYGFKLIIKAVPVLWSVSILCFGIQLIIWTVRLLFSGGTGYYNVDFLSANIFTAMSAALLPVFAYFVFLLYMTLISLTRAFINILLKYGSK